MPTSTLVLVKNKTIQKQIQKACMTVIVSLHPIFCNNFTGRYSLWHLQHVLSLAHSLLAIVPKHPYVTDLVASDFSPCFCATDISKGGQTIPTRYRTHPYTPNRVSPGVLHRSVVKYSNSGQLNCIKYKTWELIHCSLEIQAKLYPYKQHWKVKTGSINCD